LSDNSFNFAKYCRNPSAYATYVNYDYQEKVVQNNSKDEQADVANLDEYYSDLVGMQFRRLNVYGTSSRTRKQFIKWTKLLHGRQL
jgi:hypothetical protein